MSASRGFDRLARVYRLLEFAAFGRDLERTRFALLDRLAACREILVLGEGDGRCLQRLLELAPAARVDCVDFSTAMLARARRRLAAPALGRTRFLQIDVLVGELPSGPSSGPSIGGYDAVVTQFFLDCFTDAQLATLVPRIAQRLRPGASWLWADFAVPAHGWRRWYARCWLLVLHAFFAWQTSVSARSLPAAEQRIEDAGFARAEERVLRGGMLRCALYLAQPRSPEADSARSR